MKQNLKPEAVQKLKNVIRAIKADLKRRRKQQEGYEFDLSSWVNTLPAKDHKGMKLSEGFCATSGCVAGTLILQNGWQPRVHLDGGLSGKEKYMDDYAFRKGNRGPFCDPQKAAARELGMTHSSKELALALLFVPFDYQNENPFWEGLDLKSPEDAIEAIQRFIAADGRLPEDTLACYENAF